MKYSILITICFMFMVSCKSKDVKAATKEPANGQKEEEDITFSEPNDNKQSKAYLDQLEMGKLREDPEYTRKETEKRETLLKEYNNAEVDIEFYGKLVDIYGNPVIDTNIYYSIKNQQADTGKVVSDSSGYFTIKGKGHQLSFSYPENAQNTRWKINGSFDYSEYYAGVNAHKPDKSKPVDIVCLDQSIQYIILSKNFYFVWTDGEQIYHLINNDLGIDETFSFSGTREPAVEGERFSWKVILKSKNKILYKSDKKLNLAPASGYTDEIVFEMNKDETRWFDSMDYEDLYVRFKNGKYAKLQVKIDMSQRDRPFQMKFSVNPNGDREVATAY